MKTALVVELLWLSMGCNPAVGQSFDCRKASTPTEKTICGSAELAAADSRMAAAWKRSTKIYADPEGVSADPKAMLALLRKEQMEWLRKRNACGGTVSCLRHAYQQRIAVLEFRPYPEPAPVDGLVGSFSHEGFMVLYVQRHDGISARVLIDGAEPKNGRWICHFEGIGTMHENRLEAKDEQTGSRLVLERDGDGIRIPDTDSNYAANMKNCGLNGMMNFTYRRTTEYPR